jgi:hypothetical protein
VTASQNDRIVSVLADGGWHTTADIHRRAGFSRLNSRVSELRKRGLVIECRAVDGMRSGPDGFEYRLLGGTGVGSGEPPRENGVACDEVRATAARFAEQPPASPAVAHGVGRPSVGGCSQLTLDVAAAAA